MRCASTIGRQTIGERGHGQWHGPDQRTPRVAAGDSPSTTAGGPQEFEGIVEDGAVKLVNARLPEGTRVQVRVKK